MPRTALLLRCWLVESELELVGCPKLGLQVAVAAEAGCPKMGLQAESAVVLPVELVESEFELVGCPSHLAELEPVPERRRLQ